MCSSKKKTDLMPWQCPVCCSQTIYNFNVYLFGHRSTVFILTVLFDPNTRTHATTSNRCKFASQPQNPQTHKLYSIFVSWNVWYFKMLWYSNIEWMSVSQCCLKGLQRSQYLCVYTCMCTAHALTSVQMVFFSIDKFECLSLIVWAWAL